MWYPFAKFEEVPVNTPVGKRIGGERIVLVRTGRGEVYALSDICSHELAFLHEGAVIDGQIECPLHGARFDLRTGEAKSLPATEPVRAYPVRVKDGVIEVEVQ